MRRRAFKTAAAILLKRHAEGLARPGGSVGCVGIPHGVEVHESPPGFSYMPGTRLGKKNF
jgi:hypothetical protein